MCKAYSWVHGIKMTLRKLTWLTQTSSVRVTVNTHHRAQSRVSFFRRIRSRGEISRRDLDRIRKLDETVEMRSGALVVSGPRSIARGGSAADWLDCAEKRSGIHTLSG